jgi:type II secretory pathway component GspD/PulD (secretin)
MKMRRLLQLAFFYMIFPALCLAAPRSTPEFSMNFVDVHPKELIRLVYGEFLRESFVIESSVDEVLKPVTITLRGMDYIKAEKTLSELLKGQGVEVRRVGGVVYVRKQGESKEEQETCIYRPKYRPSSYLQQSMSAAFPSGAFPHQRASGIPFTSLGATPAGTDTPGRSRGLASAPSGSYSSGINAMTELDSDVLVFQGTPADIKRFEHLAVELDRPVHEVMVKAIIYEVRHDTREGSAVDLVASILSGASDRFDLSFTAGVVDVSGLSIKINKGGKSLNAIYGALSSDERFKVVSSPRVRVRSGSTARLSVGDDVPVLTSVSYDGNDRPIQSVEYKSSGVIFEISPWVREVVVDIKVNQQISAYIQTTTGVDASPTLTKRELTTELSLQNDDVVVIGGLEQDSNTEGNRGLSFFPDWLRSDQTDSTKSEILLMLHVQRL